VGQVGLQLALFVQIVDPHKFQDVIFDDLSLKPALDVRHFLRRLHNQLF